MRDFVKVGALWLLIVGVLLLAAGGVATLAGVAWKTVPNSPEAEPIYDYLKLGLAGIGAIVLAIGAGHFTAGYGMWNQRTWGRWLGAALGAGGLVLTAWVWYHEPGFWVLAVPTVGYGLTFAAALIWYPHPPVGPRSH